MSSSNDPIPSPSQAQSASRPAAEASATLRLGLPKIPSRSLGLKFLLVCLLALVMVIPTLFVTDVAEDRARHAEGVALELGNQRGGRQSLLGPVLVVPYSRAVQVSEQVQQTDGSQRSVSRSQVERGWWAFFAAEGEAKAQVTTEVLRRSIYKVPTYLADVSYSAAFDLSALQRSVPSGVTLDWTGARMLAWAGDLRGVKDSVELVLPDGRKVGFEPTSDSALSAQISRPESPGMVAPVVEGVGGVQPMLADVGGLFGPDTAMRVSMRVKVSGVDRLSMAAFAQDTRASIAGNWDDPKLEGAFVADTRRIGADVRDASDRVSGNGVGGLKPGAAGTFEATWRAPFLARGLARSGAIGADVNLNQLASKDFAVTLIQRSEVYVGVQRALRYSLLFVGTVFLAYFLFEALGGGRAHPAQYLLVGLAQCVFYLLLLAFAEQIGFSPAFLLAAVPTVVLSAIYAGAVFKSRARGLQAAFAFGSVYALMYVLMTLEDLALLAGAVTAFAAIAAVMWLTRNINWYGDRNEEPQTLRS